MTNDNDRFFAHVIIDGEEVVIREDGVSTGVDRFLDAVNFLVGVDMAVPEEVTPE